MKIVWEIKHHGRPAVNFKLSSHEDFFGLRVSQEGRDKKSVDTRVPIRGLA